MPFIDRLGKVDISPGIKQPLDHFLAPWLTGKLYHPSTGEAYWCSWSIQLLVFDFHKVEANIGICSMRERQTDQIHSIQQHGLHNRR